MRHKFLRWLVGVVLASYAILLVWFLSRFWQDELVEKNLLTAEEREWCAKNTSSQDARSCREWLDEYGRPQGL